MAKGKSFVNGLEVTTVGAAHNCQHNGKHRLVKGDKRLSAKKDMAKENFCAACAIDFLKADIKKLQDMVAELELSLQPKLK